ncbi:MAG TPA: baseplate J/gp47 family protein [Thermoanaerobaculia bacterium]
MTCRFPHPLERDGASQRQRSLPALDPASAPIDERRTEDLLLYVRRYAELLRYYSPDDAPGGTWADLVAGETSLDSAAHPPHMTLLLAFLELLGHARGHLNALTGEHLDFYYREVLRLGPKAAEPDRVHLLFELAKGVAGHRLAADTEVKAGKDAAGIDLVYATDDELVANRAALDPVHGLKTIFLADAGGGVTRIHAAPDADSADGLGARIEDEEGKWPGFGSADVPRAEVGFAVASPMFFLAEGTRVITLRIEVAGAAAAIDAGALEDHVAVYASGAKGWIELTRDVTVTPGAISWELGLGPDEDGVVAYDGEVLADGFATPYPVVKLVLDPDAPPYEQLRDVEVAALTVTVQVTGMRSLILENDVGVLDPAKPFLPFGPVPRAGSRFLIGSPEVFQKRLTDLELSLEWADLPEESFAQHYALYTSPPAGNQDFTAGVSLLHDGAWRPVDAGVTLFDDGTAGAPAPARTLTLTLPSPSRPAELEDFTRFSPERRHGFLRLALDKGFFHREYPKLLATAAINGAPASVPNAPYTPLVAALTLSYTAEETVGAGARERLFRIGPFGHREVDPVDARLLPCLDAEGALLIGLTGVEPPQSLALLFQLAEGSEDPTTAVPEVEWSYLADERWTPFETAEIVADGTSGLLTSGVIRFALPETMTPSRTVLPPGLRWIRAGVAAGTAAIPRFIAVHPQAVTASFRDQGNDPSHLAAPLPGGTIAKLRRRQAAVKSVSQPFASFGGRTAESTEAFSLRVSERLRHKGRAIAPFDYERLVLEAFPEVYKARCLNHTSGAGDEHAPGHVKVVVVPNLRNKNAVDPLKPRLSLHKLASIRDFLAELASPFVKLEVANPEYEEVRVRFNVRFHAGFDQGFYARQLEADVIGFLSPWLEDEAADLTFGGRIHRSAILHYVEKREYVDFVTGFEMDHLVGETTNVNVEEAVATRASAALVSAPTHTILLGTTSCED